MMEIMKNSARKGVLKEADQIIFMDYPRWTAVQACGRYSRYKGHTRKKHGRWLCRKDG